MNDSVESFHQNTGMEGPRAKRRKMEREQCAAQGSAVNNFDMDTDRLADPLPESTELVAHMHDVCFGMVGFVSNIYIIFKPSTDLYRSELRSKA